MLKSEAKIVYDQDCPFCSNFVSMVRLREAVGPVTLVNARDGGPIVEDLIAQGFDLDQGMVLLLDDEVHYGADAMHRIALLTTPNGFFNRVNGLVFRSRGVSKVLYPVLKAGRAITLTLMGRRSIADDRATATE